MSPMRLYPYMAHDGNFSEGAALIFAPSARIAKKLAWSGVGWLQCDFIDVRVHRIRQNVDYLMSLRANGVNVIDDPPTCPVCEMWGAPIFTDRKGCELCDGDAP